MHDEFFATPHTIRETPETLETPLVNDTPTEGTSQNPKSATELLSELSSDTSFITETTLFANGMELFFTNPGMLTELNSFAEFKEYIANNLGLKKELLEKINNVSEESFAELFGGVINTIRGVVNVWKLPITIPSAQLMPYDYPCCAENTVDNLELNIRDFIGNNSRDLIIIQHPSKSVRLSLEIHHVGMPLAGLPYNKPFNPNGNSFVQIYSTEGIDEIDNTIHALYAISGRLGHAVAHLEHVRELYLEKEKDTELKE